jgi:hypothetical protein
MLGNVNSLRTACISNLELIGAKNFSVPDVVKLTMPACTGIPEYAAALKSLMKPDGVHFTESGYSCIAAGLTVHINSVKNEKSEKIFCRFSYHFRAAAVYQAVLLLERFCVALRCRKACKPQGHVPPGPHQSDGHKRRGRWGWRENA